MMIEIQQKPAHKNPGFFKLASIGSYINGVYSGIRPPRFFIRFLISIKKQLVLMGVAFILNHSNIILNDSSLQNRRNFFCVF